jgi:threonine dehydrogenase-like Zn-dependent dehydrogenase
MRAVVYDDARSVAVREVPDVGLEVASDALVRVTSTAICGTDLHMYDGRIGATPGLVLGHEPMGVVEQVGAAVETIQPGMRVVIRPGRSARFPSTSARVTPSSKSGSGVPRPACHSMRRSSAESTRSSTPSGFRHTTAINPTGNAPTS